MASIVKNLNGETVLEDGKTIKEWMDEAELDPTAADNEEPMKLFVCERETARTSARSAAPATSTASAREASPTSSSAARAATDSVSEPARTSTPSSMRMARRPPSNR